MVVFISHPPTLITRTRTNSVCVTMGAGAGGWGFRGSYREGSGSASAKEQETKVLRLVRQESEKPIDASDLETPDECKREVVRLRRLLSSTYEEVESWNPAGDTGADADGATSGGVAKVEGDAQEGEGGAQEGDACTPSIAEEGETVVPASVAAARAGGLEGEIPIIAAGTTTAADDTAEGTANDDKLAANAAAATGP